jgi:ABC-2 type transport system ATP-binding protein
MKASLQEDRRESRVDSGSRSSLSAIQRPSRKLPGCFELRVHDIRKSYGATDAVAGLSFDVREGEVFGLLGPNGAGKTTTIAMLATERSLTGGDAMLFGHSIRNEPGIVRQMIGVAPQDIALYPMLTAAENLRFFGRLYGMRRAGLEQRIGELLNFVGLQTRRNDYVATFSGGMKRRLNLAVALVHRPKLVLLDEPTAGVDPHSREQIFEIVNRLREAGNAILYTTHYMEEAERLCDRIAIIDHGKIIAHGTNAELVRNTFGSRSQVVARFAGAQDSIADWVAQRGGQAVDGSAQFTVEHPTEISGLLEDSAKAGLELVDVSLRKPNLELVFLQLTGRELRD